jgi:hypothetical protein
MGISVWSGADRALDEALVAHEMGSCKVGAAV